MRKALMAGELKTWIVKSVQSPVGPSRHLKIITYGSIIHGYVKRLVVEYLVFSSPSRVGSTKIDCRKAGLITTIVLFLDASIISTSKWILNIQRPFALLRCWGSITRKSMPANPKSAKSVKQASYYFKLWSTQRMEESLKSPKDTFEKCICSWTLFLPFSTQIWSVVAVGYEMQNCITSFYPFFLTAFSTEVFLRRHQKTACGRSFQCLTCQSVFSALENLQTHGRRKNHRFLQAILDIKLLKKGVGWHKSFYLIV